jgi:phosphoribosylanthranilate isomerase
MLLTLVRAGTLGTSDRGYWANWGEYNAEIVDVLDQSGPIPIQYHGKTNRIAAIRDAAEAYYRIANAVIVSMEQPTSSSNENYFEAVEFVSIDPKIHKRISDEQDRVHGRFMREQAERR